MHELKMSNYGNSCYARQDEVQKSKEADAKRKQTASERNMKRNGDLLPCLAVLESSSDRSMWRIRVRGDEVPASSPRLLADLQLDSLVERETCFPRMTCRIIAVAWFIAHKRGTTTLYKLCRLLRTEQYMPCDGVLPLILRPKLRNPSRARLDPSPDDLPEGFRLDMLACCAVPSV